jgi:type I restriction enzyme S subunit
MATNHQLALPSLDVWTSALRTKSSTGRGSNGKLEAYGIKKLRELILELAVRGKLVPQDPNEEPAIELLERIAKEKARLVNDGKLGAQTPLPKVEKDDKYFGLPNGWVWTRLGEITNYGVTDKAEPDDVNEDTWVLDLEDVEKETSRLLKKNRFSEKPFRSSKNRFSSGDVIYGKLRPYLNKVLVADEGGVCTTEMVPVRGFGGIYPFYLKLVMKTPHFIKYADDSTHGMNLPRLGTDKARMALFPLAPLAEQHRIVAKVDELMALCDQLEQQQTDSPAAQQTLVETLLGTLIRVESQQEFSAAWTRIACHFDTLFTTEASIDQLKQTILQLAVMGKLVPQDPNDEPASVLLQKRYEATAVDETPFKLPAGWEWLRLGDMGEILGGGTPSKANSKYWGGEIPWVSPKDMKVDFISESVDSISEVALTESAVKLVPEGSLLIVVRGMILAHSFPVAITRVPVTINQDMKAVVIDNLDQNYVLLMAKALKSDFVGMVDRSTHGTCKLVSEKLWAKLLPIPPAAEQHRIVAKVDELMALCDVLKARLADAQTTQLHLADAIVERAVC